MLVHVCVIATWWYLQLLRSTNTCSSLGEILKFLMMFLLVNLFVIAHSL